MRRRRRRPPGGHTLRAAVAALGVLAAAPQDGIAAPAPELRRSPYLSDATAGGVTVSWGTDRSVTTGSVRWGRAGAESCTARSAPAARSEVAVAGKAEYHWTARIAVGDGARFCYRVFGDAKDLLASDASPVANGALPAGSAAPFSFAVLGDWGQGLAGGNPGQAGVMRGIAASGARFAISTGDIGYPAGSQNAYGDLSATGDNVSGVFGPDGWTVPGRSIPHFPVAGNHGFNQTFLSMWPTGATAAASGGRYAMETYCCSNGTTSASYPSAWYAFDQGDARFYLLEAAWAEDNVGSADAFENDYENHWTPGSPQYRWLEADLARPQNAGKIKFAFWHYPMYVDRGADASDRFLQGARSLEGLLHRYGVDLGFAGHAHVYQRNRATPGGLVTYVTGGGGARLQAVSGCTAMDAYAIGWSESSRSGSACGAAPRPTSSAHVHHFLLVTVAGRRVTVAPTDATGRTFDVQSYDVPPPAAPPGSEPPSGGTVCVRRLAAVPRARRARVRGIGRVRLAVRAARPGAPVRVIVKARRAKVRRVAFRLGRRPLRGARRHLTRRLSLTRVPVGRQVLRVRITPKRGNARTLKLALRVTRC